MGRQKKVDPELIVNRHSELKRWVKSIDPILKDYIENKFYYAKIATEFGYRPDTVRRVIMLKLYGVSHRTKRKETKK